jgi:hypothetical protein
MYYDEAPEARPTTPDNYDKQLLNWREQFRQEAMDTARLNEELPKIPNYIKAIQGNYWDRRRPRYKSTFYSNRIDKARVDNLSLLTDSRPVIDLFSRRPELQEQAKIVHNVFEHEWIDKDMDLDLVRVADISKLMGTGFWKFSAYYPGSMKVISCGPDSVMPVQPGFSLQESTGVLYKTWKSISFYKTKFPFDSNGIEKEASSFDVRGNSRYNRPDAMDEYVWNGLSPAMQRALGNNSNPPPEAQSSIFKSVELQEIYVDDPSINDSRRPVLMRHPYWPLDAYNWWYWVQPGERLYPRKRLIIFGGRKRLYDGPSPFWHGLYPFAALRLNPVPWSFWGLSQYRNWMPVNTAINEVVAGVLDMVKRALNPQAITKSGAVPPASWKEFFSDMPGAKLYMQNMANVSQDLRYMEPPNIPAYVFTMLIQYLIPEFDKLSNALDINAMSKKKQVPSGETLDQMRDSLNTGLRLEERYVEYFLRDVGQQAMSNVFQFYTTKQRLRILGSDGTTLDDYDFDPNSLVPDEVLPKWDHWKGFGLRIKAGSVHGGSRDREKLYAMNLYARGALPLRELYRVLEIPNGEQLMEWMKQERAEGFGPQGKPPRGKQERAGKI